MQTKFTNIRLLLQSADELYDEGRITVEEFSNIIEGIEKDYNKIVKEMETEQTKQLLLNYIHKL